MEILHERGQLSESPATIKKYVYGRRDKAKDGEWLVEPGSWRTLGEAERVRASQAMLLGIEAEVFMANVIIRLCRRRNGMTADEIKGWARAQVRCRLPAALQATTTLSPSLTHSHTSCPHGRRETGSSIGSPEIGAGCATSC